MVVKLDLANAFDQVRNKFLFEVLARFGFYHSFISWIRACIVEPWIAPFVNGRATEFLKLQGGSGRASPSPL